MKKLNKFEPITFAESISKITVGPQAPHAFLATLGARYNVQPFEIITSSRPMRLKVSVKQLQRAKMYQRRKR